MKRYSVDYVLDKIVQEKPKLILYARPNGYAFHTDKNCIMLNNGQFEKLGYRKVTISEIKRRNLLPDACVIKEL